MRGMAVNEQSTARLVAEIPPSAGAHDRTPRRWRRRVAVPVIAALLLLMAAAAWRGDDGDDRGLVFSIPSGSYERVAVPGLESAIALPTQITFAPGEEAAITIVNEDVVTHRAGPFLVAAGQTYTQRFPEPGEYVINCSVDPAESIRVIVEERADA